MMFGRRVCWSPVEVEYLKKHKDDPVNQLTIALAKSRNAIKNKLTELRTGKVPAKKKGGRQTFRIGKRKDCNNLFLRSSYEANVYRWMQHVGLTEWGSQVSSIEYEPTVFDFTQFGHKSGTLHYIPDFKITLCNGDYIWLEVKGGFMKAQDKTRTRRFQKYYPEEFKHLSVITSSEKAKSTEFFKASGIPVIQYYLELKKQYSKIIPNWEL